MIISLHISSLFLISRDNQKAVTLHLGSLGVHTVCCAFGIVQHFSTIVCRSCFVRCFVKGCWFSGLGLLGSQVLLIWWMLLCIFLSLCICAGHCVLCCPCFSLEHWEIMSWSLSRRRLVRLFIFDSVLVWVGMLECSNARMRELLSLSLSRGRERRFQSGSFIQCTLSFPCNHQKLREWIQQEHQIKRKIKVSC